MTLRFTLGDLNAFFALFIDNTVNLVLLTGILTGVFGMPVGFVLGHMVPATAIGVMIGDLAYSYMAMRKGSDATAMPLGLDTPSTIGMAVAVIGPSYVASGDPVVAWEVGMATLIYMGLVKTVLSFAGDAVLRAIPRAGLLGPLAGVGLALLGLFPIIKVFSMPIAGMVATGIILYALVARRPMPANLPGALVAIGAGLVLVYLLRGVGLAEGGEGAQVALGLHLPWPGLEHVMHGAVEATKYLPVAIPFGLLTVVGGINVTESARVAGDDYRTRDILLVEAIATLVAGFLGGVAQSTPYIGHPAYKAMGARHGYTIATGLVFGLFGVLGLLGSVIHFLPEVVVAPILLFVGIEITVQAFAATPSRHFSALAFSIIPVLAYLVSIYTGQLLGAGAKPPSQVMSEVETISILGRGFILTAMMWGAAMAFIVEGRQWAAFGTFAVLGLFTLFGVVHSVSPEGALYLPGVDGDLRPFEWAGGYFLAGLVTMVLMRARPGGRR